jgi:hypothetical protein
MMFDGLTLVVPDKADIERDAVCQSWERRGGSVFRIGRFWDPPTLDRSKVRVYGPDTFCLVLAQKLGLHLLSPDDSLLAGLDRDLLKRDLREMSLAEAIGSCYPQFVKPVTPKTFRAAVYGSTADLETECRGLELATRVLISEPVGILAEVRCFVLSASIATCAVYEGNASLGEATDFGRRVASIVGLPKTCVVDVALVDQRGWAVLEFNSTWGAGLNGCDPDAVVECLFHATLPDSR